MAAIHRSNSKNVAYVRKELREVLAQYDVIDDTIGGATRVKSKKSKYLPRPNAHDTSEENNARYEAYLTRAVFYNVTGRTLEGFMGELFAKDTVVTVPAALDLIIEDANGEGVGLVQLAKIACRSILSKGRGGLFVDYPSTGGDVTAEAKEANGYRPVIMFYGPRQVINWGTKKIGALRVLSFVVLEETVDNETGDGDFASSSERQWRVLRLDENNNYTVQLYRGTEANNKENGVAITPTDASGRPFKRIPFMFIGSEDNNADVDRPPMFDLADINIAHYRNSADYEESSFICGQPTPVVAGITEVWAEKFFGNGVGLGSRAALPLPVGATAELLQAEPNIMPKEAMEHKERQMVAIGARLVEQKQVQRTATEASSETASEKSVLAAVADNVSLAFEWAIGFAAEWEGISERQVTFRINKEFSSNFSTPEARAEAIKAWQQGAISFTEMRAALRKGGTATLTDEQARTEINDEEGNMRPIIDPNEDPAEPPTEPGEE